MWGSWFTVTLSGIGALILLIVAGASAWTPLFAFGIAAAVVAVIAAVYAVRAGRREVGEPSNEAPQPAGPGEPEHQPRPSRPSDLTGGIWGERREA